MIAVRTAPSDAKPINENGGGEGGADTAAGSSGAGGAAGAERDARALN